MTTTRTIVTASVAATVGPVQMLTAPTAPTAVILDIPSAAAASDAGEVASVSSSSGSSRSFTRFQTPALINTGGLIAPTVPRLIDDPVTSVGNDGNWDALAAIPDAPPPATPR